MPLIRKGTWNKLLGIDDKTPEESGAIANLETLFTSLLVVSALMLAIALSEAWQVQNYDANQPIVFKLFFCTVPEFRRFAVQHVDEKLGANSSWEVVRFGNTALNVKDVVFKEMREYVGSWIQTSPGRYEHGTERYSDPMIIFDLCFGGFWPPGSDKRSVRWLSAVEHLFALFSEQKSSIVHMNTWIRLNHEVHQPTVDAMFRKESEMVYSVICLLIAMSACTYGIAQLGSTPARMSQAAFKGIAFYAFLEIMIASVCLVLGTHLFFKAHVHLLSMKSPLYFNTRQGSDIIPWDKYGSPALLILFLIHYLASVHSWGNFCCERMRKNKQVLSPASSSAEMQEGERVDKASSFSSQANTMQVACPEGCAPGTTVQVSTQDGRQLQVQVPPGVAPGQIFTVAIPPQEPIAAAVVEGLGPNEVADVNFVTSDENVMDSIQTTFNDAEDLANQWPDHPTPSVNGHYQLQSQPPCNVLEHSC